MFKPATYGYVAVGKYFIRIFFSSNNKDQFLTGVATSIQYNEANKTVPMNSFNQGTGTENNPFIIHRNSNLTQAEQLKCLRFVCMSDTHKDPIC
jgi:hypothetical protein